MNANVKEIVLQSRGDARGQLIALEGLSDQGSFEIKRVYYIFDTPPRTVQGKHAHRNLRQVLICVSGACTIVCETPDGVKSEYHLNCPNKGILVEGFVWREMKEFSKR